MPDYKTMYLQLFNKVTNAINILQQGQQEGEKAFVDSEDEPILFPVDNEEPPDSV